MMQDRPIRVLIAKLGLDGHDRGARIIVTALRDAGMEVIYTGLRKTPEMVVAAALEEDVDVVGVSILSGAHMTVLPRLKQLMVNEELEDVMLLAGGVIPQPDIEQLYGAGIDKVFTPGTPLDEIILYIKHKRLSQG